MPVQLKAMIQIFKNSVFSFVSYPITVSLSFCIHSHTPYIHKFSRWARGQGDQWKFGEALKLAYTYPRRKVTVTKIEKDQICPKLHGTRPTGPTWWLRLWTTPVDRVFSSFFLNFDKKYAATAASSPLLSAILAPSSECASVAYNH